MYIEDQVSTLRKQTGGTIFCWLICFEERPLQGVPPRGDGPHLLLFSTKERADAFIAGRRRYFGDEPLSMVEVDSPATFKVLALTPARDTRYGTPPCGIVFDFDYSTGRARKVLTPALLEQMSAEEISGAVRGVSERSSSSPRYQSNTDWTRNTLFILLGLAGLFTTLLVGCLGAWYLIGRSSLVALPFLSTKTLTPMPTATPTLTSTPLSTMTLESTSVPFDVDIIDDFSSNDNKWPILTESDPYDCGPENINLQLETLVWEFKSVGDCFREQYPVLPWVKDFTVSVDIKRVSSTAAGGFGIIFRNNGNQSYYFEINDTDQTFVVYSFKNGWITLVDHTISQEIWTGEVNTLGISAQGSEFTFFINGNEVATMSDSSVAKGRIGLGAELFQTDATMRLEIDNLEFHGKK